MRRKRHLTYTLMRLLPVREPREPHLSIKNDTSAKIIGNLQTLVKGNSYTAELNQWGVDSIGVKCPSQVLIQMQLSSLEVFALNQNHKDAVVCVHECVCV